MRLTSRWWPRALLAIGAAIVIGAAVSISVGERGPGTVSVVGNDTVQRLYAGINQDGSELGNTDADVSLRIHNDLQCSPCARWHFDVVEPLVEDLARTGEGLLDLRHFAMGGEETTVAAHASTAAGEQNRQWQYAHMFFMNLDEAEEGLSVELLEMIANAIPRLEFELWQDAVDAPETVATVQADADMAAEMRLPAEPAIVVEGPEGSVELRTMPTREEIDAAIAEVS